MEPTTIKELRAFLKRMPRRSTLSITDSNQTPLSLDYSLTYHSDHRETHLNLYVKKIPDNNE